MKKGQLLNILALLMSVMCTLSASAYDFEVDGIYYNKTSSNTVEVTYKPSNNSYYNDTYDGTIVIPNSISYNGRNYTVTAIGDSAFFGSDYIDEVTIPETVTLIGKDAFTAIQGAYKLTCLAMTPPEMEGAFVEIGECDDRFVFNEFPLGLFDYVRFSDESRIPILYVPSEAYQAYKEINDTYHYFGWVFGNDWEKTADPSLDFECTYSLDNLIGITVTCKPNGVSTVHCDGFYSSLGGGVWQWFGPDFQNDSVMHFSCFDDYYIRFIIRFIAIADGKLPSEVVVCGGYEGAVLCPPYMCEFDFEEAGICYTDGNSNNIFHSGIGYDFGDGVVFGDEVYVSSGIYYEPYGYGDGDESYRYVDYSGNIVIPIKVRGHNVVGIMYNAFTDCDEMTGLSVPPGCAMDLVDFSGCTSLKKLILPVGSSIDFYYYDNEEAYNIESIYFYGDGNLDSYYVLPDRVKSLYLGSGVSKISSLYINPKTIYSYATTPPDCEDLYDDYYEGTFDYDAELHVPASSLAAYFTAPHWCNFTNIIGDITPITDFSLAQDTVKLLKGSQFTFDPIITPAHVVPDTIIWQSTNKSVATVKDGVVTAVGTGECEIQAICQGKFVICRVFVTEIQPTEVVLSQENAKLEVGETLQLSATVHPANATNKTLYWSTSDSRVATVSSNGLVTAIAPGNATITASTGYGSNLRAPCTVVVTDRLSDYDNYLSLNDVEVFHGDTIVIPVAMTNAEQVVSFQTDILLPEGLEIVKEDGEYLIDPSDRMTRTHSIMSNDVSSGAVRVMCYSSNYKPFTGNSGDDLFYITVKVNDDAKGDYIIQLENTLFTTSDFEEIAAPDVAAILNVKAYLLGDVNGSGVVTVTDVVLTAQYVLEQNPQPFIFEAADVNADGNITVTDVTRIAWMVLNPTQNAPRRVPAMWNSGDCMSAEAITLKPGETRKVSIMLDNTMAYTAFQLDLMLPDGLTAGNFQLTDRAGGHALAVNSLGNGDLRALCYSPALDVISGHDGALLTFDVKADAAIEGTIGVKDIELVTADCMTVLLDGFAIGVNSEATMSELNGTKVIARVDYYNLVGQRIERPESGVTLVVTTYTDGTCTTAKVIK